MRVLFALNYINSSKQISKLYKKNFKESIDSDVTSNKLDTFKLLKENQYDVLIINSTLDGQAFLFSEIEYIFKSQLANRIILMIENEYKNSDLPQMLYNLGVLDGLFEEDSTNINISELINRGRDTASAKEYYNASDEINLLDNKEIDLIDQTELLILSEKMKELSSEGLIDFFEKLKEIYSDEQLQYLIKNTDLEIRGKLLSTDTYNTLIGLEYKQNKQNIDNKNIKSEYLEDSKLVNENFNSEILAEYDDLDDLDLDDLYFSYDSEKPSINIQDDSEYNDLPSFYEGSEGNQVNSNYTFDKKDEPNYEDNQSNVNEPEIIEKIIEVEKVIERVVEVEKVVEIEKIIEVEKVVEKVIEVGKNIFNRVIIGVMGVKKGIGTTYNSISIAKYLSKTYKVAVVEFKKDFLDIAEAYEINVIENNFNLENLDYYSVDIEDLYKKILNLDYQYIVVDFGTYSDEVVKDFYRTDIKLVLCGTQVWEDKYLSKFLTEQQVVNGIKYLFNMSKYREDIVDNMPGLHVQFIDYFEDISYVSENYQAIIQEHKVPNSTVNLKKRGLISTILGRN